MRGQAYRVFAIAAWPAACWGALEVALRVATGQYDGLAPVVLLSASAAGTIVLAAMRRRQLRVVAAARE
ncbi:MAG: hypothetical protein HYX53_17920 [Chloroflexi bacterium]|nr:hypothetical protein [Chloroflexota bacterium]